MEAASEEEAQEAKAGAMEAPARLVATRTEEAIPVRVATLAALAVSHCRGCRRTTERGQRCNRSAAGTGRRTPVQIAYRHLWPCNSHCQQCCFAPRLVGPPSKLHRT